MNNLALGLKLPMFNSPICISLLPILALPPRPDSICKKPQDGGAIWAAKAGLWAFSLPVSTDLHRKMAFIPPIRRVRVHTCCMFTKHHNKQERVVNVRSNTDGRLESGLEGVRRERDGESHHSSPSNHLCCLKKRRDLWRTRWQKAKRESGLLGWA